MSVNMHMSYITLVEGSVPHHLQPDEYAFSRLETIHILSALGLEVETDGGLVGDVFRGVSLATAQVLLSEMITKMSAALVDRHGGACQYEFIYMISRVVGVIAKFQIELAAATGVHSVTIQWN